MTSTDSPTLTLRKADGRYYVSVNDVKVGWVLKNSDGWSFYSTVYDSLEGRRLSWGNPTRRDALMEGLSELRIRHGGRVRILLFEPSVRDEWIYVPEADLKALWERLLDEKYPTLKENS